jgi:SAM-dependent methyltransferase
MTTYDSLARFYDLENADFIEDLDFWVGLAKEAGGPVLELGCGSGRVTQQIARAGIAITGIDNSEPMLAMARARLNRNAAVTNRVTLVNGDMTKLDATELKSAMFNLVICPFNTFMHLLTVTEQIALLTSARQHLEAGGQLVLDLTNPAPAYADPPSETLTLERTFRDEAHNQTIEQFSTLQLDRLDQIAHIVYRYDALAVDGALSRTLVPLTLRYTFPAEMALLLGQTGFRLAHLYGDYDEEVSLGDESERMVVVAEAV